MIVARHIDPEGLKVANLDVCIPIFIGPIKASATNAVFTTQTFASTVNTTFAPGTQVDFARNLLYLISVTGGTASNPFTAGTIIVQGSDMRGSAISETVNASALGLAGSSAGVVKFARFATNGISISNMVMHTASSSNSNSVTFAVGLGNVVGLPNPVGSVNPIKYAYEGTSAFTNFTAVSGPVGTAGVSVTPTLGSGSNLQFIVQLNGADFRGLAE
jgi:hypothetical protein